MKVLKPVFFVISITLLVLNTSYLSAQELDKPAPDFTLKDREAKDVTLSDLKGKVVLIDFWATWCGPCLRAMPFMQNLQESFKGKDFVLLGVNTWERKPDKVASVLKYNKITYKILLDSKNNVVGKYGVKGIPTFFIIDKKGIVRYSYLGLPKNKEVIKENIEKLLAEK